MNRVGNFIYHYAGLQGIGPWYGAWSGFLGFIEGLSFVGVFIAAFHHLNCQYKGCPWPRHHTTAQGWSLCRKCLKKPLDPSRLPEVHDDHR